MTRNVFEVLKPSEPDIGTQSVDGGSRDTGPVIESIDPGSPFPNR